jgi:hypothetical protein
VNFICFKIQGGGGLMSGICLGVHGFDKNVRIFGAEPKNGDDAKRSLEGNQLVQNEKTPETIADGLLTNRKHSRFKLFSWFFDLANHPRSCGVNLHSDGRRNHKSNEISL